MILTFRLEAGIVCNDDKLMGLINLSPDVAVAGEINLKLPAFFTIKFPWFFTVRFSGFLRVKFAVGFAVRFAVVLTVKPGEFFTGGFSTFALKKEK